MDNANPKPKPHQTIVPDWETMDGCRSRAPQGAKDGIRLYTLPLLDSTIG